MLRCTAEDHYAARDSYTLFAEEFHTIRVEGGETALLLQQFRDRVPLDEPTRVFSCDREPPSLSGLYSRLRSP
jgi:hypothetical protein